MKHKQCNHKNNNNTLDRFFDDFLGGLEGVFGKDMNPVDGNIIPNTNIIETDEGFKLEIAAPGWSKSDFKIHLEKDTITISTDKDATGTTEPEGKFKRKEFETNRTLKRSFTLPETVDKDNISARYINGVLNVMLPKLTKEEVTREVKIS